MRRFHFFFIPRLTFLHLQCFDRTSGSRIQNKSEELLLLARTFVQQVNFLAEMRFVFNEIIKMALL